MKKGFQDDEEQMQDKRAYEKSTSEQHITDSCSSINKFCKYLRDVFKNYFNFEYIILLLKNLIYYFLIHIYFLY